MSNLYSNSIFWIDTDKVKPNPYQPRRDFDEDRLQDLAQSIKQYGVLQPLTVSRLEVEKGDGGIVTEYELIAGERRLRAAKMAGVSQVPVIIRTGDTAMAKLELAIIENLQREDLNAVDRARAFSRLYNEFKFTHGEIAKKIGRSREYVTNSIRILGLPEEVLEALSLGKISEGHTRPILML
ncbi:MAG TPA: ParB/RepB/Spo0J family partition protein, partial [Candidatus Paceibacterota bacterium]